MKILRPFNFVALAVITLLCSQVSADDLTFVEDIPATILFGTSATPVPADPEDPPGPKEDAQGSASSQATFGNRNADAAGTEGTRTRGQNFTFVTGDGLTHDIGSLSVSLNNPINNTGFRPDGQLELTVFEWDSNDPEDRLNWSLSTGGIFTEGLTGPIGHTELYRESFPVLASEYNGLESAINETAISDFLVQISFDAGKLQLTDGTTYGFLFRYTLDSLVDDLGAPLTSDISFAFDVRQDNNIGGALLSNNPAADYSMAANGSSASRDMNFFFAAPSDFLLGDVDLSGTVDFLDIVPFIDRVSSGTLQAEADCNEDGSVDFLDIAPFIAILSGS